MFKHVVVGVDEHDGGRDAIALAQHLLAAGGVLTLVHVDCAGSYAYRGASAAFEASQHERALEQLDAIRAQAGVEARLSCVSSSSPGRGLHEFTESRGADLLVLGSSRRSLVGRVLMGDDTHAALNGASCAVAIAPAGYIDEPAVMREIGVGYDRSPESERALALAREIAAELGARLSAFEVISLPRYILRDGTAPLDLSIADYVEDARQRIEALGGVDAHAVYGNPAEELAVYSASLDLLIVGSRGYGPLGRLMHGSTSHQLARAARCPLLVLPRAGQ